MKVKRNVYDILVEVICILLLVGLFGYLITQWGSLPDKVPAHYNGTGEIDRWSSKGSLLFMPIIGLILYIGITVLEAFPKVWNTGVQVTEENKEKLYRTLMNMIQTTKLIMVLSFFLIAVAQIRCTSLPWYFTLLSLGLIFGVIIYYIVRIFKMGK